MRLFRNVIAFLSLLLLTAGAAAAQTHEESVEASNLQFIESMKAMADFVKDVNFDEDDIKAMIAHWVEFNALGGEGEGAYDEEEEDEMIDFKEILAYPAYRSWAKSKGFDPDQWMKKFMRIQLMMMKDSITASASEGSAQLEAQLAEIEAQRAQIGEEMYQQIIQAIQLGATTMSNIGTAYDSLPEPTPAEKALLDKYRDQLMSLE
jgi:ABC-type Zn uptake system ZnuABC Zn-binding protein ZnuA